MSAKTKPFLVALLIGLLLAGLHFLLSHYIKVKSCPPKIARIYALAQHHEIGEALEAIAKLNLNKTLTTHLIKHYGEERAPEFKNKPDPDGIYQLYTELGQIQKLESEKRKAQQKIFGLALQGADPAELLRRFKNQELSRAQQVALQNFEVYYNRLPRIAVIAPATRSYYATGAALLLGFLVAWGWSLAGQIYTKILLGMIAGAAFGYLFGPLVTVFVAPLGVVFIRLIKMVVVPLVFASLSLGVISLGDLRKLGRIGGKTLIFYLATTSFAIAIGLVLANVIRPGSYIAQKDRHKFESQYESKVKQKISVRKPIAQTLTEIVPTNPVQSMTQGKMLQIIFFALFFGVVLAAITPGKKEIIEQTLDGVNEAMIKMVIWIMEVAPFGAFALMADTVAKSGISILKALGVYALVVVAGLVLHVLIVYGTALRVLAGEKFSAFLQKVYSVQLMAFSTSSSAATLPVSMRCAEEKLGVSREIASFVLPLGATVNMDGTALYQGVAAVFIAQVYGIPLDFMQQLTILLTATLASIGTAAVPGAGIVILAMVLESIGVPVSGIALIMGVDRILDMCRTTINVTGDLTATVFVHRTEMKRKNGTGAEQAPSQAEENNA